MAKINRAAWCAGVCVRTHAQSPWRAQTHCPPPTTPCATTRVSVSSFVSSLCNVRLGGTCHTTTPTHELATRRRDTGARSAHLWVRRPWRDRTCLCRCSAAALVGRTRCDPRTRSCRRFVDIVEFPAIIHSVSWKQVSSARPTLDDTSEVKGKRWRGRRQHTAMMLYMSSHLPKLTSPLISSGLASSEKVKSVK